MMYLKMAIVVFFLHYYSSKIPVYGMEIRISRFTEWKSEFPGLRNGNQNFPVYGMEKGKCPVSIPLPGKKF